MYGAYQPIGPRLKVDQLQNVALVAFRVHVPVRFYCIHAPLLVLPCVPDLNILGAVLQSYYADTALDSSHRIKPMQMPYSNNTAGMLYV